MRFTYTYHVTLINEFHLYLVLVLVVISPPRHQDTDTSMFNLKAVSTKRALDQLDRGDWEDMDPLAEVCKGKKKI